MENQNNKKSMPVFDFEEMKIYTPRHASRRQEENPAVSMLDQAPVRIYERPIKSDFLFLSEQNNIG